MRILLISLLLFTGCITTKFQVKKERLQQDIEILKLEVRKELLENRLEKLENE